MASTFKYIYQIKQFIIFTIMSASVPINKIILNVEIESEFLRRIQLENAYCELPTLVQVASNFKQVCYLFTYPVNHGLYSNGTHDFVVKAKNVKIQYFFKKILNSYVYVSVDNDAMKIQKEIEYII